MRTEDRNANAGRSIARMIAGKKISEADKKDIQDFRKLHEETKQVIEENK